MESRGRLARWIMDLQEFQFTTEHRLGRQHANTDALSRLTAQNLTAAQGTRNQTKSNQSTDRNIVGAVVKEPENPTAVGTLRLSLYYVALEILPIVLNISKVGAALFCQKLRASKI